MFGAVAAMTSARRAVAEDHARPGLRAGTTRAASGATAPNAEANAPGGRDLVRTPDMLERQPVAAHQPGRPRVDVARASQPRGVPAADDSARAPRVRELERQMRLAEFQATLAKNAMALSLVGFIGLAIVSAITAIGWLMVPAIVCAGCTFLFLLLARCADAKSQELRDRWREASEPWPRAMFDGP